MYVGLDISKRKTKVCIIDVNKNIISEFEIDMNRSGFEKLEKHLTKEFMIGMEPTGNYSETLFNYLSIRRFNVNYVDNLRMNTFAELYSPDIKNDKMDSKLIALYLAAGLKTVNPIRVDELKDLSRLYRKTISQLTKYKFMFKNQINVIFPELDKKVCLKSTTGIPYLLLKYPTPKEIAKLSPAEIKLALSENLKKSSIFTLRYAEEIKELAANSVGVSDCQVSYFKHTIKVMMFYRKLVDEIKSNMKECLNSTPYAPLLNEWGYNVSSLSAIVGEIGTIKRFPSAKHLASYSGLRISQHQSGTSINKKSRITKAGNRILRHNFFMITLNHLRYKRDPYSFFHRLKARGLHPKKCAVAASRKIATKVYYDMLKCHNKDPTQKCDPHSGDTNKADSKDIMNYSGGKENE